MTAKHDGFYSYEKWEHPLCRENGVITCPIHGDFPQTFNNHREGSGCPHCANLIRREKSSVMWREDPNKSKQWAQKISDGVNQFFEDHPEVKDIIAESTRQQWQDPEYAAYMREIISKNVRAFWQDPENRARMVSKFNEPEHVKAASDRAKEQWEDPEFRELMAKVFARIANEPSKPVVEIALILQRWDTRYQGGDDLENEFTIPSTAYRFDFYLPDFNLFIEYHGKQHYEYTEFFHKSLKDFHKGQKNDKWKADWAIRNGYDLKVISYKDKNNIEPILAEALGM